MREKHSYLINVEEKLLWYIFYNVQLEILQPKYTVDLLQQPLRRVFPDD